MCIRDSLKQHRKPILLFWLQETTLSGQHQMWPIEVNKTQRWQSHLYNVIFDIPINAKVLVLSFQFWCADCKAKWLFQMAIGEYCKSLFEEEAPLNHPQRFSGTSFFVLMAFYRRKSTIQESLV